MGSNHGNIDAPLTVSFPFEILSGFMNGTMKNRNLPEELMVLVRSFMFFVYKIIVFLLTLDQPENLI